MKNNRGNVSIGVLLLSVALALAGGALLALLARPTLPLGANSGPEHTNPEYFYAGLSAGTQSSPTLATRIQCGSATWNPGVLQAEEVTSTAVTVGGVSVSSTQAYFGGITTSTVYGITVTTKVSSTVIMVRLESASGTAAVDLTTTTAVACYLQF